MESCHHIRNTPQENLIPIDTVDDVIHNRFRFCRNCNRLVQQFNKEEDALYAYCQANGVIIRLHDSFLTISTPASKWKIIAFQKKGELTLFHHNTYKTDRDHLSPLRNYHLQRVSCDSITGYLAYIIDHDIYRRSHPVKKLKQEKPPAPKGSKRYIKEQKRMKKQAKKQAVKNVLALIDNLQYRSHA